ncbi:lipoyl(octanoyl) transferase LipB [Microlunatus sp. Gsoil 973]|uniref:lipoyl(octanoyl) transferase LipB n=1 Tax=Microlunatus sp. Gsoil 973 TaxID=2672569 RepID=UPI0012B50430|nr:lipoyl(octanoyl) transferase LipB [Microlunatus sp. Gsoil 973]QGN33372.1 lipoyl(octanoyl) transferase LipB [Microlunatus sp. Gsoil 973]
MSGALDFLDLDPGERRVDYLQAWALQRRIHAEVVDGDRPDTVLLLEHDDVYTAGKRTEPHERPADGTPVVDVDRGGHITWHGRGQLVAYPIVALPDAVKVVDYVRRLEEAMIRTFDDLGLPGTGRIDGRSGVWLPADDHGGDDHGGDDHGVDTFRPERKIAAIGIRVASGVTMHGVAMNISNSLSGFDKIVPCGISDAGVATLQRETGRTVPLTEVAAALRIRLADLLSWQPYARSADIPRPALAGSALLG